jgi:hypothetical protein
MKILITEDQLKKITESQYEMPDFLDIKPTDSESDIKVKTMLKSRYEKGRKRVKIIYDTFRTGIINAYGIKLRYILPEDDYTASGDGSIIKQPYLITIKEYPKFNKIEEDGTEIPYPFGTFRLLDLIAKIQERFLRFKIHLKIDVID